MYAKIWIGPAELQTAYRANHAEGRRVGVADVPLVLLSVRALCANKKPSCPCRTVFL